MLWAQQTAQARVSVRLEPKCKAPAASTFPAFCEPVRSENPNLRAAALTVQKRRHLAKEPCSMRCVTPQRTPCRAPPLPGTPGTGGVPCSDSHGFVLKTPRARPRALCRSADDSGAEHRHDEPVEPAAFPASGVKTVAVVKPLDRVDTLRQPSLSVVGERRALMLRKHIQGAVVVEVG